MSPRLLLLSRLSLLLAAGLGATACGGDPGEPVTPDGFVAPTSATEVDDLYDRLGTCNDSYLTRTLTPRDQLLTTTLWSAPDAARAGLTAWRQPTGWNRLLLANEVTFDGVSGSSNNPDPACAAVQNLFTPLGGAGGREQYTHALLYLDEADHPYTSYPAAGIEAQQVPTAVSLTSYLVVTSAVRETSSTGAVTFRDVVEQHLPMYVSCTRPLEVETGPIIFEASELGRAVDPALCDAGLDLDGDGELEHRCVSEHGLHVADNACTFVVDGSALQTATGARQPAIFGGTLTTQGSRADLRYTITVDRFSR